MSIWSPCKIDLEFFRLGFCCPESFRGWDLGFGAWTWNLIGLVSNTPRRRQNDRHASHPRFLPFAFRARCNFMFACLALAMTFAKLLLNFFEHEIDRRIEIALDVFGENIRSGKR